MRGLTWQWMGRRYLKHGIMAALPDSVLRHLSARFYHTFFMPVLDWQPMEEKHHGRTTTNLRSRRSRTHLRPIRLQAIPRSDCGMQWRTLPMRLDLDKSDGRKHVKKRVDRDSTHTDR